MTDVDRVSSIVGAVVGRAARHCSVGYGLLGAELKHVSEVPRGLACGCRCIECGLALVAKKGAKRAAHFAHHDASTCDGGLETLLHRLAKEVFERITHIELPAYEFKRSSYVNLTTVRYSGTVRQARRVSFTRVDTEKAIANFIPDIVIWNGRYPLVIEIAVTHRVDQEKLERIKSFGAPAIEIRLSAEDSLLTREELMSKIEKEPTCKHWLFHPHLAKHEKNFHEHMEKERRHQNAVQRLARQVQESVFRARRPNSKVRQRYGIAPGESLMDIEAAINRFYRQHEKYPSIEEAKTMLLGYGLPLQWLKRE